MMVRILCGVHAHCTKLYQAKKIEKNILIPSVLTRQDSMLIVFCSKSRSENRQVTSSFLFAGVVLASVINSNPGQSCFILILDGRTFKEVARAYIDTELHKDVHGYFIPQGN